MSFRFSCPQFQSRDKTTLQLTFISVYKPIEFDPSLEKKMFLAGFLGEVLQHQLHYSCMPHAICFFGILCSSPSALSFRTSSSRFGLTSRAFGFEIEELLSLALA